MTLGSNSQTVTIQANALHLQAESQSYNSLQAGLQMREKHGLSFQLSYTYSHEIDIQTNDAKD